MTTQEQMEFQTRLSASRYRLIEKSDLHLHTLLDAASPDWEAVSKAAGVRVHLFRELLELSSLLRLSVPDVPNDYKLWMDMLNKDSENEQKEETT